MAPRTRVLPVALLLASAAPALSLSRAPEPALRPLSRLGAASASLPWDGTFYSDEPPDDPPPGSGPLHLHAVGYGDYSGAPALFLSRTTRMVATRQWVFPVPLLPSAVPAAEAAVERRWVAGPTAAAHRLALVSRDGDLWDSLPWEEWGATALAKRDAYNAMTSSRTRGGAYDAAVAVMAELLRAEVEGLALEVSGEGSRPGSVRVGGVAILRRGAPGPDPAPASGLFPCPDDPNRLAVPCAADEVAGLSCALGLPVAAPASLYDAGKVVGEAVYRLDALRGRGTLRVTAEGVAVDTAAQVGRGDPEPPMPWEVGSVQEFDALSVAEKRASLTRAGQPRLPRPREGERKLDDLLLPLLDEAVRAQVLRRRALERGDWEEAARLQDNRSERDQLLEEISTRREADPEDELLPVLEERYELLTSLRADPTLDEGSYDPYLDQDEWYEAQRRAMMGKKKR